MLNSKRSEYSQRNIWPKNQTKLTRRLDMPAQPARKLVTPPALDRRDKLSMQINRTHNTCILKYTSIPHSPTMHGKLSNNSRHIYTKHDVHIHPSSETLINTMLGVKPQHLLGVDCIFKPSLTFPGKTNLAASRALVIPEHDTQVPISVINTQDHDCILKKRYISWGYFSYFSE